MKRKILFVIDSLQSGGAEKSLISLLSLFDYGKYEVDLLMFVPKGLYLPLLPKQVHVLEVPVFMQRQQRGIRQLIAKGHYKDLFVRLRASLAVRNPMNKKMHGAQVIWGKISGRVSGLDRKYDVAVAYSQGMPTYFVAEKVSADKKLCWVNTDYRSAAYNKSFDLRYYQQFDNIIAVSETCRNVLSEVLPEMKSKIKIVYDIISPALIKSMASHGGGFADDYMGLRILTIGRLAYHKGYEMAIEACYKLKQDGYDFKWYAIGEGNLKDKFMKLISDYKLNDTFIFLGIHQNPYTFLKQSDIYVQSSRYEGYGLAIAEARILQKPIVATNFTVIHNQIRNGETGLIAEMNSQDLYLGIKRMIEDQKLRERICFNLSNETIGTEEEIFKVYSLMEKSS